MLQEVVLASRGWQPPEIAHLQNEVRETCKRGEPLRDAFVRAAQQLGRKPNSIRNFYYAQLRTSEASTPRTLPFQTFTDAEVRDLMREVLAARGRGESVRACVRRLAGGDPKQMLRLQNKYRSVLKSRAELVAEIMAELRDAGEPVRDPLADMASAAQRKSMRTALAAPPPARDAAESTPPPAHMTLLPPFSPGADTDLQRIVSALYAIQMRLQMGKTDAKAAQRVDRLQVSQDLLRMALEDAQQELLSLRGACVSLLQDMKEFVGAQEHARQEALPAFCMRMAAHICAVENQLHA